MSDATTPAMKQALQLLYAALEKANIAWYNSQSVEDAHAVHALEAQVNALIDTLIEMDAEQVQP